MHHTTLKRNVSRPAVLEYLQGLSTNSQGTELRGSMDRKRNMTFEKREMEGVKDRLRMTVPCETRALREMKEWREEIDGLKRTKLVFFSNFSCQ